MLRIAWMFVCLVTITACREASNVPPATTTAEAASVAPEPEPVQPGIDTPIEGTPEAARQALLLKAIQKVATEYRADWMLQPNEGSSYLTGQIESIYAQGRAGMTFYGLVKQAFQNTREDFLNRAEVAKTSAEILYRAQIEASRNRELSRLVRQQNLLVERQRAAEQASMEAGLQAQAQAEVAYASAANASQHARQEYRQPEQGSRAMNSSRFDPDNVGFDSRKGYTSLRYSSGERSNDTTAAARQSGPTRFQDQNGRWYEQPPGSGFARDERTGQQCFLNGAFVLCK